MWVLLRLQRQQLTAFDCSRCDEQGGRPLLFGRIQIVFEAFDWSSIIVHSNSEKCRKKMKWTKCLSFGQEALLLCDSLTRACCSFARKSISGSDHFISMGLLYTVEPKAEKELWNRFKWIQWNFTYSGNWTIDLNSTFTEWTPQGDCSFGRCWEIGIFIGKFSTERGGENLRT